jgi:hypothetical protein
VAKLRTTTSVQDGLSWAYGKLDIKISQTIHLLDGDSAGTIVGACEMYLTADAAMQLSRDLDNALSNIYSGVQEEAEIEAVI